ncbi:hypothetical protein EDC52_101759 [Biostraticola tofi]|uniref:YdaS antitoxin of YdaST toxin-antitoxin system n=1 Tax=Biostraticola tofi TaxID=466109 RepID=A0A4R3Z5Q3_9GAMM|nr:hypothetical protein EDC52_101759 [Biostraticola tofi]
MMLTDFIDKTFGGNKAAFARHMGVDAQTVNKWVKAGWLVIDDKLCSPRRDIPPVS